MADESPNLDLPYLLASQAQKHVTHNEALRMLDGLVQMSVKDRHLATPPGSPAEGDRYIVPAGATGDWSGWAGSVALYSDGAWLRLAPNGPGWLAWVEDEKVVLVWSGTAWVPPGARIERAEAWWRPVSVGNIRTAGLNNNDVGTISTPTPDGTSLLASMRRWRNTSAASANSRADQYSVRAVWRGDAAGLGGFDYTLRWGLVTLQSTGTGFFGLQGSTAGLSATLLLADIVDAVGVGFQQGTHSNWQLVVNDGSGTATLTDLGASFPVNTTDALTLRVSAPPNGSGLTVELRNETSGAETVVLVTTNIPGATQWLSPRLFLSNLATAAAVAYDCAFLHFWSDY
jgi:hypothetical protein